MTNKTPEFLAKFPLGKIPVFEGADGFCLAESVAIAMYVAESGPKAAQLVGADAQARAKIAEWSFFSEAELFSNAMPWVLSFLKILPYVAETHTPAAERFQRALGKVEATLKDGRKHLVGDQLTLADIMVASMLFFTSSFLLDADMRKTAPASMEWLKSIVAIPEFAKYFGEYKPCETRNTGA